MDLSQSDIALFIPEKLLVGSYRCALGTSTREARGNQM